MQAFRAVNARDNRAVSEAADLTQIACGTSKTTREPARTAKKRPGGSPNAAGRGHRWRNGAGHSSPAWCEPAPSNSPRQPERPRRPSGTVRRAKSMWPPQLELASPSTRPYSSSGPDCRPVSRFLAILEKAFSRTERPNKEAETKPASRKFRSKTISKHNTSAHSEIFQKGRGSGLRVCLGSGQNSLGRLIRVGPGCQVFGTPG